METSKGNNEPQERILILAPKGKDAELTARFLNEAGLTSEICGEVVELCRKMLKNVGIVFLTSEVLEPEMIPLLIETLQYQPPWSDIPLIILTSGGSDTPANFSTLAALSEAGNVTLIERPVRLTTLISSVKSALRARRRQFEARDFLLAELRSKEHLQQSEERFRALQQATPDGFMIFESVRNINNRIIDFRWVYVNPAAEGIVGRPANELIGKLLLEELFDNRLNGLFDEYSKVVETGEIFQREFTYQQDGLNNYFHTTAVKVRDGFAVGFKDITSRRKVEADLRDARMRLESTLAAAEVGTWTWDCIKDSVIADKNLARMFSVSAKDAEGGKIENYLRSIHPEDRERTAVIIGRAIEEGNDYQADYRLVSPDGTVIWVIARGIVERNSAGQAVKLPGVVVDVTELKQAEEAVRENEEKYRSLFNSIDEGFCVIKMLFDENGNPYDYLFLEVNPTFGQQTGLINAAGKTMLELVPNHEKSWFEIYGKAR